MSSDAQFTALGPTEIGFQTHGANIQAGGLINGNNFGVLGACGAGLGENGAGVQGTTEAFNSTGVVGIADNGPNAFGVWGLARSGFAGQFDGRVRVNGQTTVNGNFRVNGKITSSQPIGIAGLMAEVHGVESPESWFEDLGFGRLVDSYAQVELDGDFASTLDEAPYHVFVTEYDGDNGIYVADRTPSGFAVRASTPGVNAEFSYRVAAKRKGVVGERFAAVPEESNEKERPGAAAEPVG